MFRNLLEFTKLNIYLHSFIFKINYCNTVNSTQPRKNKQVASRGLLGELPMLSPHQEVPHRIPSAPSNVCNLSAKKKPLEIQYPRFFIVNWSHGHLLCSTYQNSQLLEIRCAI